jgi:hypothetical protein
MLSSFLSSIVWRFHTFTLFVKVLVCKQYLILSLTLLPAKLSDPLEILVRLLFDKAFDLMRRRVRHGSLDQICQIFTRVTYTFKGHDDEVRLSTISKRTGLKTSCEEWSNNENANDVVVFCYLLSWGKCRCNRLASCSHCDSVYSSTLYIIHRLIYPKEVSELFSLLSESEGQNLDQSRIIKIHEWNGTQIDRERKYIISLLFLGTFQGITYEKEILKIPPEHISFSLW